MSVEVEGLELVEQQDRFAAMGPRVIGAFGVLAYQGAFNSVRGENFVDARKDAFRGVHDAIELGIKPPFTAQEMQTFGAYVGQAFIGTARERGERVTRRQVVAAEIKAVKWFGEASLVQGDETTARNAGTVLGAAYSIRGKMAAYRLGREFKKL